MVGSARGGGCVADGIGIGVDVDCAADCTTVRCVARTAALTAVVVGTERVGSTVDVGTAVETADARAGIAPNMAWLATVGIG